MVVGTKPGSNVPVKVMRNKQEKTLHVTPEELNLDEEQGRQSRNNDQQAPEEQGQDSFGITLSNVTPQMARRLQMRERAPMTVAAFMDLALYHPELGYYARAARQSGRAGDFFASVDVGPLFGELLAVQIAEMARILAAARSPSSGSSASSAFF